MKNNHSYKNLLKLEEKNSPFKSILEKTSPSSLFFKKELRLRAYFIKPKIFCLGLFVEILDMSY